MRHCGDTRTRHTALSHESMCTDAPSDPQLRPPAPCPCSLPDNGAPTARGHVALPRDAARRLCWGSRWSAMGRARRPGAALGRSPGSAAVAVFVGLESRHLRLYCSCSRALQLKQNADENAQPRRRGDQGAKLPHLESLMLRHFGPTSFFGAVSA